MGIPSYYSYIIKNNPSIVKDYKIIKQVNNFYLDCNSIIYDIYNSIKNIEINTSIELYIIQEVINKIEFYINIIKPNNNVIIAFDGVAPLAKLNQQRSRRYKSWFQSEIVKTISNNLPINNWNTASITPGTNFMTILNETIKSHFDNNFIKYNVKNIYVSGSNIIGEGEHKIFNYMRMNKDTHLNQTTVVYGLDADLIMLCINHLHICPNVYLYRETPHFISFINNNINNELNYVLDINQLSNLIATNLLCETKFDINNIDQTKKIKLIHDYIFITFLMGNDFLPHFPSLNIRTGGIDKIINGYKATIGNTDNYLTNGNIILWNNVRKLITFLANFEEEYLIKEHNIRNKLEYNMNNKNVSYDDLSNEDKLTYFENTPIRQRDIENYINPNKPYWEFRYYKSLFDIVSDSKNERKKEISINYLEGLEWNLKYYTTDCPDWRWEYKYNYPPLLADLIKYIPVFNHNFIITKPVNPVTDILQLSYVLPKSSLNLLPDDINNFLIQNNKDYYNSNHKFMWAYCKYFWESHVIFPSTSPMDYLT